jgi:hypothetical protein
LSYYLIKVVPFWGLTLIGTSVAFLAPLIYKTNKELIDTQISNASKIVNQQTEQVKSLASHHASVAASTTKQYVGDYSAKAQEIIGARARSQSPAATRSAPAAKAPVKEADFPVAPNEPFVSTPSTTVIKDTKEPILA